jgi:cyclohexa-1,5-dienecarbonyl-CoA hydratase
MPIELQRHGRAATLKLDRPPLNILDLDMLTELDRAVAELSAEPDLTVLFVRGAGNRAFSAGVAVEDHAAGRVPAMLAGLHGAIRRLRALPAVTVAAVHGHCLGGGMELALSCDLMLASDDARFAQPEVDLGCFPPVGAALYPALLGPARTLELLLTGRALGAAELEAAGLVARRVPAGRLDEAVASFAAELAGKSAAVVRLIKQAVRAGRDLPFPTALAETERLYLEQLCRTADMEEGIAAFLAKRRPVWQHG